jgi:hypothetical protein
MTDRDDDPGAPAEPERRLITTHGEYLQAAGDLLERAQRELCIFDPDLAELGLDRRPHIETLQRFLSRGRDQRIWIALHNPEHVKQRCPRLITLLGSFSSSFSINRTQGEAAKAQDCFVLADRLHVVRRPVARQPRGVVILGDAAEGQGMRERFREIWESSEHGVSASTSGL